MLLLMISGLLGHSTTKMSERYAHLTEGLSGGFMHLLSAAAPAAPVVESPSSSGPPSGPGGGGTAQLAEIQNEKATPARLELEE